VAGRLTGTLVQVKWNRAVQHLEMLAGACAEMAAVSSSVFSLRVVELWAVGDILGPAGEIDVVTVALGVDLPVDEVPWLSEPPGAQHWANATRLAKNPIRAFWRSAHAPIWNHHVDRPVLVWDSAGGVADDNLAALREGRAVVRPQAPTPDELRARLADELRVSLVGLRGRSRDYDERRWKPGRLEPAADALWQAGDGYLDVLDATQRVVTP
jgi:hypothetical protein